MVAAVYPLSPRSGEMDYREPHGRIAEDNVRLDREAKEDLDRFRKIFRSRNPWRNQLRG